MGWFRIHLTEEQRAIVNAERDCHPDEHVRRKMLVLWLLHCRLTRDKVAAVTGLGRAAVQRYVAAFRDGGLDGPRPDPAGAAEAGPGEGGTGAASERLVGEADLGGVGRAASEL